MIKDRSNFTTNKTLEKLSSLTFFNTSYLKTFYHNDKNVLVNLSRWEEKGYIIRLKKGFYTTSKYLEKLDGENRTKYVDFIANKLVPNSYLSDTYMLNRYNILTEMTYTITSVTTGITRGITNKLGRFQYKNIKPELFKGFEGYKFNENYIYYAPLYKALFDYFYFRKKDFIFSEEYVDSLRLNWENIDNKDMELLSHYCKENTLKKMLKVANYLYLFKKNYVH